MQKQTTDKVSQANKITEPVYGGEPRSFFSRKSPKAALLIVGALIIAGFGAYQVFQSSAATTYYSYVTFNVSEIHRGSGPLGGITVNVARSKGEEAKCYSGSNKNFGVTNAQGKVTFHCNNDAGEWHGHIFSPAIAGNTQVSDNNHGNYSNGTVFALKGTANCQSSGASCPVNTITHYMQGNRDNDEQYDHDDACPDVSGKLSNGCNPAPLYRLYHPVAGKHFWTTSLEERNVLVNSQGFRSEGVGASVSLASISGLTPLHRLYHPVAGKHFWTTNSKERDVLVNSQGFRSEGIAAYVTTSAQNADDVTPFHRLYHPVAGKHFWTTSLEERNYIVNNLGFRSEGIAGYTFK